MTTRKIAIVRMHYSNRSDDDYGVYIADAITEWEEVTQEEFIALCYWQGAGDYRVIEETKKSEVIGSAIKSYKAYAARQEAEKKKYAAQEQARKERSKEAAVKRKQKQLEKLASEAGVVLVPKIQTSKA